MGNPPFIGYSFQDEKQKEEIKTLYVNEAGKMYNGAGKIDYVAGWYMKAAMMMEGTDIQTAFVSTNSITQGDQVITVWKPLFDRYNIHIDFAHRTFRWDSEATKKAHVHVVIVGFSITKNNFIKVIYEAGLVKKVKNINAYLVEAPNVFIQSRSKPLCGVLDMTTGNRPADGGHLIIDKDEYQDFIEQEPLAKKYIKKLAGGSEYIDGEYRYCLWLVDANPAELRKMPLVMDRIRECREDRLQGAPDRQKLASTPTLFRETKNPKRYLVIPATSSEKRKYIPIGYLDADTIPTNAVIMIPNAPIHYLGILTSNVHMSWMRAVAGRLEMRYRYSKKIVYNNFPWPNLTDEQKQKIELTSKAILDSRDLYPESSLADLYDELTMPPELRKAHQENDKAVMEAYGFNWREMTESECVAELMRMYQSLVES